MRVQQRGWRWSSPSFSALLKLLQSDWCCSPSPLPSFPSVDSEWNKNKFVASWSQAADQCEGEGRSWESGKMGLKRGKEGFYVTEWKIPRIDRHMPLLFLVSLRPIPHPHLLPICLRFPVSLLGWSSNPPPLLFHFQGQVMPRRGTISDTEHTRHCSVDIQSLSLFFSHFWDNSDGYNLNTF